MTDQEEKFYQLVNMYAEIYPHRQLTVIGDYVHCDGERAFNCKGYSVLYNNYRLCELLKSELI